MVCFPYFSSTEKKNKRKFIFYSITVNTEIVSSHVLQISEISFVLRICEITDIFNTFDEIYLVFTSKKVNILYIFSQIYNNKIDIQPMQETSIFICNIFILILVTGILKFD